MDAVVSVVETLSHQTQPVIVTVGVIILLRSRLIRAICWNVVLWAMRVPHDQRQSIVADAARADLGTRPEPEESEPATRDTTDTEPPEPTEPLAT